MTILLSSRRTIMSGEVVTISTAFGDEERGMFGGSFEAMGCFEVSASRDAVMVHRAECRSSDESEALIKAIEVAEKVRTSLEPHWRGGHPSMYPSNPTDSDQVFPSSQGV